MVLSLFFLHLNWLPVLSLFNSKRLNIACILHILKTEVLLVIA